MTRFLDSLNLRPQERKLVVFVMIVVFVALNWFFVRPYFGELGRTQQRMIDADKSIKTFTEEIQRKPLYQKQKDQLAQKGGQVPSEEQATALAREVGNQAGAAGVNPTSTTLVPRGRGEGGRTNAFFEEQAVNLTFANTGESELVNFLFGLASQNSLIRVKSMTLRPDPGGMRLGGTLTLVESFQKKPQAKGAATTAPAPAPSVAVKPATPPKTSNTPPKTAVPPPKPAPGKTGAPAPATMKTNFPPKRMLPGAPPAPK
jgi:hypothetical protein